MLWLIWILKKADFNNQLVFSCILQHEKVEEAENGQNTKPEFLQVHAKLRARMEPNK